MQNISNSAMFAAASLINEERSEQVFTLDTTFVLFFLAVDLGHSWLNFGWDGMLAAFALAVFAVVPYFLSEIERATELKQWLTGRLLIAAVGISLGLMFRQSIGVLLPEWVSYLPMTLLIVAGIVCCNVQIYGILKVRLAR